MYAPPPAAAPGGAARTGLAASGPILAICCLLFILFLIASTIVLALIPVYLSTRDSTATGKSPSYLLDLDQTDSTTNKKRATITSFDEGQELDSDSRTNTANAVISKLGLSSGAFLVDQCITKYITSRKRRGFGLLREARASSPKLFCKVRFNLARCGRCGATSFLQSISTFVITVSQTLLVSGSPVSRRITYLCKLTLSIAGYPSSSSTATGKVLG
ncbi:hypothetical protein I4U23_001922 [Adineta vaga]|nr:hypothetical protein I4U23_001922 [Adineta vaga]